MVCFKNWILLESLHNFYNSCKRDIIIEKTCIETLKIMAETDQNSDQDIKDDIYTGNIEDEKFPEPDKSLEDLELKRNDNNTEEEPSEKEIEQQISQTMRKKQKELHDAILVLRWNAMSQRAKDISEIKKIRDEYLQSGQEVSESTEENDDDELEFDSFRGNIKSSNSPSPDRSKDTDERRKNEIAMKAAPLLKKLGYIDVEEMRDTYSDEQIKTAVAAALLKAADEEGNEVPSDVEQILNPQSVRKATEKFFFLTREIFKSTFRKIVRSQIGYVQSEKGYQKAGRLFDPGYFDRKELGYEYNDQDIDDIAGQFTVKMLENFTTREVSRSQNKPQPWLTLKHHKNFGKLGLSELDEESQQFVDVLVGYIRSTLRNFSSNQERERKLSNAPSGPSRDLDVWGGNRDKKANLINSDIEKGNLEFYKSYMAANDENREKYDKRLEDLNNKLKNDKKLSEEEHEEKWRLEILQQIFFLQSRHSESLSLNPKDVISTLQSFRSNFLSHKYRKESFFGSMGRKSDDGTLLGGVEDLGFGVDPTAKAGDAGSNRDRGSSSEPSPPAAALDNEFKRIIHNNLLGAFNALKATPIGQRQALSLCVLWDLGDCGLNTPMTNVDAFSRLILKITKQKKAPGEAHPDCAKQLLSQMGSAGVSGIKSIDEAAAEIKSILGENVSTNTIRLWINKGLEFICDYMKKVLGGTSLDRSQARPTTLAPTPSPVKRFDASRTSPLASRIATPSNITSTGVPKIVTDPVTGKRSYRIENN